MIPQVYRDSADSNSDSPPIPSRLEVRYLAKIEEYVKQV